MRSEAQKRADKKYHAKTYRNLQMSVKIADYEIVDNYCKSANISKASFIINACKYCIDNNIDLSVEPDQE